MTENPPSYAVAVLPGTFIDLSMSGMLNSLVTQRTQLLTGTTPPSQGTRYIFTERPRINLEDE